MFPHNNDWKTLPRQNKKEETIFIDNRRIWSEIYEWKIY